MSVISGPAWFSWECDLSWRRWSFRPEQRSRLSRGRWRPEVRFFVRVDYNFFLFRRCSWSSMCREIFLYVFVDIDTGIDFHFI